MEMASVMPISDIQCSGDSSNGLSIPEKSFVCLDLSQKTGNVAKMSLTDAFFLDIRRADENIVEA